jgi:spermine oxidase
MGQTVKSLTSFSLSTFTCMFVHTSLTHRTWCVRCENVITFSNLLVLSLSNRYNATIIQKYSGDSKKIKILNEALRLAEKVSLMIDGAFSWLDTSTVKHYERSEGHQLLVWKGRGYRTVLDVLTGAFPDPERKLPIEDKILLNKQVSKIVWNGDSQVVVHTSDNSSYNADHVIFTPSVGVLKELKDSLFTPSLPSSKQDAIEAIGIAGVMKIVMHFETEWWKGDDVIFSFIWREEDLLNIAAEFSAGPVKMGSLGFQQ